MDQILEHVLPENREWVSKLSLKSIADILNVLALIPEMKEQLYDMPVIISDNQKKLEKEPVKEPDEKTEKEPLKEPYEKTEKEQNAEYKSDIPAMKGLAGENKFESIISQFMSNDYELINVSKQGKAGDFIIKWMSTKTNKEYKILVDIKNYSKNSVPTSEVDKFYRDVSLNNVDGGFLLSFNSKITGINKLIEFREFMTDRHTIPILYMTSSTPLLIAESIKMHFHIIEIKDLTRNSICDSEDLIYRINQLNDSIQTIIDCRDILEMSKLSIDKSLNTIMMKLMSCEYDLISKINNINSTLTQKRMILNENKSSDEPTNDVKHVMEVFGSLINEDADVYLHNIYKTINCSDNIISFAKKTWALNKDDVSIIIKFQKTCLSIIFPIINTTMTQLIKKNNYKKIITHNKEGYVIKINQDTISYIIQLIKLL